MGTGRWGRALPAITAGSAARALAEQFWRGYKPKKPVETKEKEGKGKEKASKDKEKGKGRLEPRRGG